MGKKNYYKGKGGRQRSGAPTSWTAIDKENADWEAYYKAQGLVPEGEWDAFKLACQTTLPLTFRITGSKKHAVNVRDSMEQDYIPSLQDIEWEGAKVQAPEPIAFYPDELAWTVKVGKQVIRKNQEFARFQRFLVVETAVGNMSRQEAVSMIPPLFLEVEPHHVVFDMCAAPGSKTGQLIEALHQVPNPTGFVVANDSDYRRSFMLIHQIKRLNTPNLIVTNHDAALYPRIQTNMFGRPEYLKFDRVLCDVPCSGDATMRKNINVWKEWGTGNALGLHQVQVNILVRGIQLLKPGGRLVYSTCSLNPIENEAVIAEAMRQNPNTISLVDVSDKLPGLKRCPGVSNWKVQNKQKEWVEKGEDGNLAASCFPPTEEEAAHFKMDRSVRVYPHQQDTGGFFIAVFEKIEPVSTDVSKKRDASPKGDGNEANKRQKSVDQSNTPQAEDVAEAVDGALSNKDEYAEQPPKKERMPRDANEEPFKFLNPKHDVLNKIWEFYGINDQFHRDALMVRNQTGDPVRTIYYVAPQLKEIILANENRLKFVHAGIKMFTQQRNEGSCKWRIQSEGLELIYPFISDNRVVDANNLEAVKSLCENPFNKFDELKAVEQEFGEKMEALSEGCGFMRVTIDGEATVYPIWRGRNSANIMLPKEYTQELLHRVFKVENVKLKGEAAKPTEAATTTEPAAAVEATEEAAKEELGQQAEEKLEVAEEQQN